MPKFRKRSAGWRTEVCVSRVFARRRRLPHNEKPRPGLLSELARISGHCDLRVLQNVYYAPSVGDLAAKLDQASRFSWCFSVQAITS
jgi:hypothetical protein